MKQVIDTIMIMVRSLKRKLPVLLLSFFIVPLMVNSRASASALTDSLMENGNRYYMNKEYGKAADCYTRIISLGYQSSVLFYNLGNACFKQNNMPRAILYYEKARLLDPGDEDIRQNLAIANSRIVDKIGTIPDFFLNRWISGLANSLAPDQWALLGLILFLFFLIAIFFYVVSRNYRIKKVGFSTAVVFLILSLTSLLLMQNRKQSIRYSRGAIVMTPVVNVKSSPDEQGTSVFLLHEGTRVILVDSVQEWKEVKIPDGNKGWVPDSILATI